MRIAGIVAEYNPFHNGHAYQIEQTRSETGGGATHVVAVMSGSFMQRGEPALLPKADRARMALAGGADLVLELPLPWALSSAETFARGAVSLLCALRCVDVLSFGSEEGNAAPLRQAAALMEQPRFTSLLRYRMEGGSSYPEARQMTLTELGGERLGRLLTQPNNTLGIEYLRALQQEQSPMEVFTVPRLGAAHDAVRPLGNVASAGYIRTVLREGRLMNAIPFLPAESGRILTEAAAAGRAPASEALLDRAVLSRLRRLTPEELSGLPAVSEGIENRLYTAIRQADSLEALLTALKTRRYPMTRLRRLIYSAFLGVRAGDTALPPPYLRPLGANERGMEILRAAKAAGCTLPFLSRASRAEQLDARGQQLLRLEYAATDQYALALPRPLPCGSDLTDGLQKG